MHFKMMKNIAEIIHSIFMRIRLWGIKGIYDYLLRQFSNFKLHFFFLSNARKYPLVPEYGITILADMTLQSSLSKTMRDLVFALRKANIPFQTFDLHPGKDLPSTDIKNLLTPTDEFRILKYNHVIEMFSSPLPKKLPIKRSRIIFWEFTTGLLEYNPIVANAETIIAMSDFNFNVFKKILPETAHIKKILYPFFFDSETIPDKTTIRGKYGIPDNAIVVFFNFDYGSSFNRKNPDGSLRAFANAFANTEDAFLVFKTKGAARHQEERCKLLDLAAELNIHQRMIMIDSYIPQHDIYGLTNACDIYLSLHRGEGFGLGIVEAMSLAKPVIVTNYSSTTEFCNPTNSIPIPYSIVKVPDDMHDHPCYHAVKEWAEPDIDAAANALRKLYDNPTLRTEIGRAAQTSVNDHFSTEHFKESISSFLQDSKL